eukprot:6519354-Pyramimonas_sp.AAC.1
MRGLSAPPPGLAVKAVSRQMRDGIHATTKCLRRRCPAAGAPLLGAAGRGGLSSLVCVVLMTGAAG